MKYWITTHWPRFVGENEHEGVRVQDSKEDVIRQLGKGDRVFIYEVKTGPTPIEEDGTRSRQTGAQGIVALVTATDRYAESEESQYVYTNGKRIWWRWYAPTEPDKKVKLKGVLPRKALNRILGYKSNYTLRGFGEDHSGLMEIEKDVFDKLLAACVKTKLNEQT